MSSVLGLKALADEIRELGRLLADEADYLSDEEMAELRQIARTTPLYKPGTKEGRFVLHLLRGVATLDVALRVYEEEEGTDEHEGVQQDS